MSHGDSSSLFELLNGAASSPDDLLGLWQEGLRIVEASLRRPGVWRQPCRALGSDPTVDWLGSPAREILLAEGLRQALAPSYGYLQALALSGLSADPWLPILLREFLDRCRRCHDPLGTAVSFGLRRAMAEPRDPAGALLPDSDFFASWWEQPFREPVAAPTAKLSVDQLGSRLRALELQRLPTSTDPARLQDLEDRWIEALRRAIETEEVGAGDRSPMPDLLQRIGPLPEARDWPRDHRLLSCVQEAVEHLGVDDQATDRLRTLWLLLLVARERGLASRTPPRSGPGSSLPGDRTEETLSALAGILRRLLRACEPSEERPAGDAGSIRSACLQDLLSRARRPPVLKHHRTRNGELVVRRSVPEALPVLWLCVEITGSLEEVELLPAGPLGLPGLPQLSVSTPLGPLVIHCSFPVRCTLSEVQGVPGRPSLPPEETNRARELRRPTLEPEPAPELAATWSEDQSELWRELRRVAARSTTDPESPPGPPPSLRRLGEGCFSRLVSFFAPAG